METTIKTTLAKKNSEMEKLEKSKKSHLRMISSSAARLRLKYGKSEDPQKFPQETDVSCEQAKNIRMYETHFPGFCYLRNGQYRRKATSNVVHSNPDPVQCSEKVKAILFTNGELDVYKTMCLHLLGTHIQNKNHIQRKDGRLCSYVKAQLTGSAPHTLHPVSQRVGSHLTDSPSIYDKMLPRYILDVRVLQQGISTSSVKTTDNDSGSDEETKKKRKLLVPIYINNEIRMIINSVIEALEAVESSKLNDLVDLASSPEELRNMLAKEEMQDYIIELCGNPLIMKPTSYDFVMAHLMFDKIPEKGTLETVAQVLEVYDDTDLKCSLQQIRRAILQRHLELVNSNIIPGKKISIQDKVLSTENSFKFSNPSVNSSLRIVINPGSGIIKQETQEDIMPLKKSDVAPASEKENVDETNRKKSTPRADLSVTMNLEKTTTEEHRHSNETEEANEYDDSSAQGRHSRADSSESNKCDLRSLNNSERILLGLKVASLKCKPINMHQFEGKKKVDLAAIINPIIRPHVTDIDYKQNSPENHLKNFSLPEKKIRTPSKVSMAQANDLENLTRALLANLRLEISETENRRRVCQFMAKI